ncbi:hypothetical protein F5Y06DRAFT_266432 [Hypoxylon sp. FL0890]|nr:hypothetical protein F5Y06DRAFT_266432 [Hypoxylon sp. FL0890]
MPETLREKATKKIQGLGANVPTNGEGGATETLQSSLNNTGEDINKKHERSKHGDHETLREKAVKKFHGPDANPSQLGDPISLKAETSNYTPTDRDEGAHSKRESKL